MARFRIAFAGTGVAALAVFSALGFGLRPAAARPTVRTSSHAVPASPQTGRCTMWSTPLLFELRRAGGSQSPAVYSATGAIEYSCMQTGMQLTLSDDGRGSGTTSFTLRSQNGQLVDFFICPDCGARSSLLRKHRYVCHDARTEFGRHLRERSLYRLRMRARSASPRSPSSSPRRPATTFFALRSTSSLTY